jgi:uncharacterized membrane protein required for colicin V production
MMPGWLSLIDVAFVAVALLFALGGLQKGFASQVAHIVALTGLGVALLLAYPAVFNFLGGLFRNLNETYMTWMLLAGLVVLTILFFMFITKLLAGVVFRPGLRFHAGTRPRGHHDAHRHGAAGHPRFAEVRHRFQ